MKYVIGCFAMLALAVCGAFAAFVDAPPMPTTNAPTMYVGALCYYAHDTIYAPNSFSRYCSTTITTNTKHGTRIVCNGTSTISGRTANITIGFYDLNGGSIVSGDNLHSDSLNTSIRIYTPSIGHDSTYALKFDNTNITGYTVSNDTVRVTFSWCLVPLNGLSMTGVVKFKQ